MFAMPAHFISRCGMPAYTKAQLDGKSVEVELSDRNTRIGILRVRHNTGGLEIQVECHASRNGGKETIESGMPDRKFLRKHPKPERAEYIWAEHVTA